jgi:hypothetical protein
MASLRTGRSFSPKPFDAFVAKAQFGIHGVSETGGNSLTGLGTTGMQSMDFVCVNRDAQALSCWDVLELCESPRKLSKLREAVYYCRKTPESRQIGS